nr:uncharacterized protein LOC106684066 isoform X1 [Halyomorpha halys]
MKVLCFFLSLALGQVALAYRITTSGDDDSITGLPGINLKEHSSTFQTKSQQSSSSAKVVLNVPHTPTVALPKPKPLKLNLPGHPEFIAIPHPEVVAVPHPSTFIAPHVVPKVHYVSDEHHHLSVFQLSNGLEVVPLDDHYGRVSDYLYLGTEINLVPGSDTFFLPATDLIDGHTTYVNLGTESGHLSLSEVRIGTTLQQGFQGFDEIGPVFVPVKRKSERLHVNPIAYRTNRLSYYNSSSSSQFNSTYLSHKLVDHTPFHHLVH